MIYNLLLRGLFSLLGLSQVPAIDFSPEGGDGEDGDAGKGHIDVQVVMKKILTSNLQLPT